MLFWNVYQTPPILLKQLIQTLNASRRYSLYGLHADSPLTRLPSPPRRRRPSADALHDKRRGQSGTIINIFTYTSLPCYGIAGFLHNLNLPAKNFLFAAFPWGPCNKKLHFPGGKAIQVHV